MPVNDRYPLDEVLAECRRYFVLHRRKVFVEYVMLAGVNDRVEQATELARAARSEDLQGQPDPLQPDGRVRRLEPQGDRLVRRRARAPAAAGDRAPHARPRHRRRLRPARGARASGGSARKPNRRPTMISRGSAGARRRSCPRAPSRIPTAARPAESASRSSLRGGDEPAHAASTCCHLLRRSCDADARGASAAPRIADQGAPDAARATASRDPSRGARGRRRRATGTSQASFVYASASGAAPAVL